MAAVKRLPALARRDCRSSIHRWTKTPNRRRLTPAHQQLLTIARRKIIDFTPGRPHVLPEGMLRRLSPGQPRSRWLKALGIQDQLVDWFKPAVRPKWLTVQQWKTLPELLRVRELRYRVARP